jgi:hypothetical protein
MGTALHGMQPRNRVMCDIRKFFGLAVAVVVLGGCATPAHRIRGQPALFASFPPEAQALIREGRIDLGFDPGMVEMALGAPTDVYRTRNEQGEETVWTYRDIALDDPSPYYYGPYPYGPAFHTWGYGALYYPPPVVRRKSAERLRVTFRDGRVTEIQSLDRSSEAY